MTTTVRGYRPADAPAAAEAVRSAYPHLVTTPETVAWQVGRAPAGQCFRLLVAECGGEVAGVAHTGLVADAAEPGQGFCNPAVHPAHRGRGAGTALLAAAEEYLRGRGAVRVHAWTVDDGVSPGFAERRGYRRGRRSRALRLDLAGTPLPPVPPVPEGVRLCTAADLAADPRPLYAADVEASRDEPGDVAVGTIAYEDWLATTWDHPALDRSLSTVALADGAVAAFTLAHTDRRGRYLSGMTGTVRAHRGRGLARLVKADSLHRARVAGCTEALTGNDAGNAPMLAVNARFGYTPYLAEWRCVRDL
ncbi:GNAT family N-acetyltransferase [Streptacidiphilus sp. ASG 303]|uniref:GNAT family N-acetyltransferase n=1 Tax=Streptacidiphilus sp. ASG 303 TaxID=2896847 RepID=UPI001E3650A1|nr:GNAT family N-acetyltransferase [Streptacidiphilus sp. ASG 303]MCD0483083.1 GNAT family N-acetyltransferase [Streptacidiphilus sp. ASG 303]